MSVVVLTQARQFILSVTLHQDTRQSQAHQAVIELQGPGGGRYSLRRIEVLLRLAKAGPDFKCLLLRRIVVLRGKRVATNDLLSGETWIPVKAQPVLSEGLKFGSNSMNLLNKHRAPINLSHPRALESQGV